MKTLITLVILLFVSLSHASSIQIFELKEQALELNNNDEVKPFTHMDAYIIKKIESIDQLKDFEVIDIPLPEGFNLKVKKQRVEKSLKSDFYWIGKVINDPNSYVVLVVSGKNLVGEIFAGGKNYRINSDKQNRSTLFSTSLNRKFLPEDDVVLTKKLNPKAQVTETSTDSFVDVIIGYTAGAAANPTIEAEIEAMVVATNEMLANSCVNYRYRLLSIVNTGYDTGADDGYAILDVLEDPAGALAMMHTERDNVGADLVHLIIDTDSAGLCGLANLGGIAGNFFDDRAFGLTLYGCPSFVLAHELGHNMSLRHDRYQQGIDLTDDTAIGGEHYGYVDLTNLYESIMSYSNHCYENGLYCEGMNKFSNPRILHNGVPFGLDQFADNTDGLNRSFQFVSNYRDSQTAFSPDINLNCVSDSQDKDLHCFIATATYGSTLHPKVDILRGFRDQVLKKFSLGRFFIKTYYKYSPSWSYQLRRNQQWKTPILWFLTVVIFSIQYFWFFMALTFVWFFRKRILSIFVFLMILSPSISRGDMAISPYDISLNPINPSLTLSQGQRTLLGISGQHRSASGEPTSLMEIKESGTYFDLLAGYRSQSFAFSLRYMPEWEFTTKTTTQPFTEAETSEKSSRIMGDIGFVAWNLPIGLRIAQDTKKDFAANQSQSSELKVLSANLGSQVTYANLFLGGGLIYQSGEKSDFLNNDQAIKTNWLSLYAAIGLSFKNNMSGSSSFGISSSSDMDKGFQAEIGFKRDPEVVAAETSHQLVMPETTQMHLLMQYLYPYGSNYYLASFRYTSSKSKVIENFIPDVSSFDKIQAGFGYQTNLWSLTSDIYYLSERQGYERNEIGLRLALAVFFPSGGDGLLTY